MNQLIEDELDTTQLDEPQEDFLEYPDALSQSQMTGFSQLNSARTRDDTIGIAPAVNISELEEAIQQFGNDISTVSNILCAILLSMA